MKKEVVLSVVSLIFMVLFTTGTTFLYFKKRKDVNVNYITKDDGIQMGFDNYSSFMNISDENVVEQTSIKLYVRYKNVKETKKLKIKFNTDPSFEERYLDKQVYYEITDKEDNFLIENTDLDYLTSHYLYETTLDKLNEDYIYTIKIIISKESNESFNNIGQFLMNNITAEIS